MVAYYAQPAPISELGDGILAFDGAVEVCARTVGHGDEFANS